MDESNINIYLIFVMYITILKEKIFVIICNNFCIFITNIK